MRTIAILILVLLLPCSLDAAGSFRAGVSKIDITPEKFPVIVNGGFLEGRADKAQDRLHARALVLSQGKTRIVICLVDTCMLGRELMDEVKNPVSKETGIPTDQILIAATHTHTAPSAFGCLGTPVDPNYPAFLKPKLIEVIIAASRDLVPARMAHASIETTGMTHCRRWIRRPDRLLKDPFGFDTVRANMHPGYTNSDAISPSGPTDDELTVLLVETAAGEKLALLANFSMHYFGTSPLSADYFGLYAEQISTKLKGPISPRFLGMMSQGTSGDAWWGDYSQPEQKREMQTYADEMMQYTARALEKATYEKNPQIAMEEKLIRLHRRVADPSRLNWAREEVEKMGGAKPTTLPQVYALEQLYLADQPESELKIQAIRLGDFAITALPNEVYALTGLKLKRRSPFGRTMNIELANGAEGYIPPPEQHYLGGYTTWAARTAALELSAEPKLVDAVLGLLKKLSKAELKSSADQPNDWSKSVVKSNPVVYWRLDEMDGFTAHDQMQNHSARLESGVVHYLPGPKLDANKNQTVHFAGGRLVMKGDGASRPVRGQDAPAPSSVAKSGIVRGDGASRPVRGQDAPAPSSVAKSGTVRGDGASRPVRGQDAPAPSSDTALAEISDHYAVEFWFWNGLATEARGITGYLFSRSAKTSGRALGDHLGIGGTAESQGRLFFFNGHRHDQVVPGRSAIPLRTWNHLLLVRSGEKIQVYLNGVLDLDGAAAIEPLGDEWWFGGRNDRFAPLEGRLDEIAIYAKAPSLDSVIERLNQLPASTREAWTKPRADSKPTSAQDSLAKIHTLPQFKVELVASEPVIRDPIAFDWDGQGRLWVVEMSDYPLGLDGKMKAGGRVRILEDLNEDGVYEKSQVFLEGLNFPTGIITWKKGCILTAAPDIIYAEEDQGKCVQKTVLYRGFREGNPQLRINGLRWGLDHWLYCANGWSGGTMESTKTGVKKDLGGFDVRIDPNTGEFVLETGTSQFGRARDVWGNWFGLNNSFPLWHYPFEQRYLSRNADYQPESSLVKLTGANPEVFARTVAIEKRFHSFEQAGHFTSASAPEIYSDRYLFPESEGSISLTCEPFHNLIHQEGLLRDGPTFRFATNRPGARSEIFASEDRWCRPVMARTGPDGAIYVADMYRYMIEHPDWLPEKGKKELAPWYRAGEEQGRIYRIVRKDRPPGRIPKLGKLTSKELVQELNHANGWIRDKAQQFLLERGPDVQLASQIERQAREGQSAAGRLQSWATLDGWGMLSLERIKMAWLDPNPELRVWALRWLEKIAPDQIPVWINQSNETSEIVLFQGALSAGGIPGKPSAILLAKIAAGTTHSLFQTAILTGLSGKVEHFWEALSEPHPETALRYAPDLTVMAIAEKQPQQAGKIASFSLDRFNETTAPWVTLLAQKLKTGDWDLLMGPRADELRGKLRKQAVNAEIKLPVRLATISFLGMDPKGAAQDREILEELLQPSQPDDVRKQSLKQLAASNATNYVERILSRWNQFAPSLRQTALEHGFLRPEWTLQILSAVQAGQIATSEIDMGRRQILQTHPNASVKEAALKTFPKKTDREKVIQNYASLGNKPGDPARGALVFNQACSSCHRLGETGKEIGPGLISVRGHSADQLLVSILDPSRYIEPGFATFECQLKNGEELYGLIKEETAQGLVFKMLDGTLKSIPRTDLALLRAREASLMPEGLEESINLEQMSDLIAFLQGGL